MEGRSDEPLPHAPAGEPPASEAARGRPEVLSYHNPARDRPQASPLLAALLCLPGAACWLVLLAGLARAAGLVRVHPFQVVPPLAVMTLWGLAIPTAIVSLCVYVGKPKPWYVVACLLVNGTGLLFTLLSACVIASAMAAEP